MNFRLIRRSLPPKKGSKELVILETGQSLQRIQSSTNKCIMNLNTNVLPLLFWYTNVFKCRIKVYVVIIYYCKENLGLLYPPQLNRLKNLENKFDHLVPLRLKNVIIFTN